MTILENFDSRNFSNHINSKGKLTPSSRINPCEGCGDEKGNCRVKGDYQHKYLGEFLLYCMGNNSSRKGELVGGNYKVIGHTKCGLWAMLKPDNSESWTEEKRRQWEQNKPQREQQKQQKAQQQHQQRRERALSNSDRHEPNSKILASLPQDEKLIAEFQQRSLTPQEIADCEFKSVAKYQELPREFDPRLPGVTQDGKRLIVSGDGYLIPIKDFDRHIVAFQVRLYDPGDGGRYRWVSSTEQTLPLLVGESLENPLAVYHSTKPKGIAIVEGTGAKPFLTSRRLKLLTIGASGGQFDSSPNLLKNYLNRALIETGGEKTLDIFPDSGDVQNRQVINRWKRLAELLNNFGWDFKFAWWGQLTKNDCDIDELNCIEYPKIQYISAKEFFAIADQQLKLVLTPDTGTDKTEAFKPTNPNDWKEAYELRRKDRASFKFTRNAQIVVKDGFLPFIKLEAIQPGIIGIRGDWGIGKSFLISSWCKEWEHKIIQVAHLNALLSNTAPKFDCFHHRELKDMQLGVTSASRLSITDISLAAMFDPEKWAKGEAFILILDEIEQALHSIQTNSNLKGKLRLKARIKLEWLIRNATYIIASDRDLCDETLNYIEQVRSDNKKAFIIHHTGKKGISRQSIVFNFNKRKDEVLTQLINDAKLGKKIIIPCENKSDLLAIELQLRNAGIPDKSMFFAHGDNSNEPGTKELIEKADEIYTDYQIIGYTMTMGTALSFEKEHFGKCYAFFSGDVLSANAQAQMLFRYRPECDITVWINPRRRILEIHPDVLLSDLVKNVQETDKLIASIDQLDELIEKGILINAKGEIPQDDMPWLHHKLSIIARANASKANPFQSLHDLLIEAGFTLKLECNDDEEPLMTDEGNNHKEQKKEIKSDEDKGIADAELMSDPEFQSAMMSRGNLKKSERERLKKTQLHRDTGLEITQPIVKLQRTKKLTEGVKALKVLLGDEATAVAYDLTDRERNPDVYDQKFYATRRRLLCDLGIPEILNKLSQGWSYTNDSSEVVAVAEKARKRPADIKRLLGFTISFQKNKKGSFQVTNSAILGSILNTLCVERESKKTRTEGNIYKLNLQHWEMLEEVLAYMDRQAHTPTLAGVIEKAQAVVNQDSVPHPQNPTEEKITPREETLETQPQRVFEGVPHPDNISYIYKHEGMEQKPEDYIKGESPIKETLETQSQTVFEGVPHPDNISYIYKHEGMEQKPEDYIKGESPIEKLLKISNWAELGMTQSELNEIWPLLSEAQRSHLWEISQQESQQLSLEKLAEQAIATQAEVKETGFGFDHFRSYVIKAVCDGVAIARRCWGLKDECEIPLNQLLLATD